MGEPGLYGVLFGWRPGPGTDITISDGDIHGALTKKQR